MTPLRAKKLVRRVGQLVVECDEIGVTFRKFGCRTRLSYQWEQVACLGTPDKAVIVADEKQAGIEVLRTIGIENLR